LGCFAEPISFDLNLVFAQNLNGAKPDLTLIEVHRYAELLAEGDPKAVETLFLAEQSIFFADQVFIQASILALQT
jgi:hypothetical protein